MRRVLLVVSAGLALGCSESSGPGGEFPDSGVVLIVNGASSAGSLSLYIDGTKSGTAGVGGSIRDGQVPTGDHQLELRFANGSVGLTRQLNLAKGDAVTIVALDSAGVLGTAQFGDSNAVVPAGATKLRVAHFAQAAAPIDIWRTQPDYGTPIRVQFPFNYQDVSPYLQSTVGDWQVFVSTPVVNPNDPLPDTLGMTAKLAIPDGESRTIVVVDDSAGGVALYALDP